MTLSADTQPKPTGRQQATADFALPPTISSPNLLDDNGEQPSDRRFRQMIYDLLHLETQMRAARDRLGAAMGVSGPAYAILMAIAQFQDTDPSGAGLRVSDVAARLHVTGAFVTAEVNRLVAEGLIEKRRDPEDGRAVRLALSQAGAARVMALAPKIRAVNDHFFGDLSAVEFDTLSTIVARMGDRLTRDLGQVLGS